MFEINQFKEKSQIDLSIMKNSLDLGIKNLTLDKITVEKSLHKYCYKILEINDKNNKNENQIIKDELYKTKIENDNNNIETMKFLKALQSRIEYFNRESEKTRYEWEDKYNLKLKDLSNNLHVYQEDMSNKLINRNEDYTIILNNTYVIIITQYIIDLNLLTII